MFKKDLTLDPIFLRSMGGTNKMIIAKEEYKGSYIVYIDEEDYKHNMKCISCNSVKDDTDVFWGQDCNECRDTSGIAHGCYSPQINFSKLDATHRLFANIIKPHHFLRNGTLCEIIYWDGGLTGAYIRTAISKGGRVVGGSCGLWVRLKHLGNYRIKWSYSAFIEHEKNERNKKNELPGVAP